MERTLHTLSLTNKIKLGRHRDGNAYFGITTSPTDGFLIKKELSPHVQLLAEYPVFSKKVPGGEVHPFGFEHYEKNNKHLVTLFYSEQRLSYSSS